MRWLLPFPLALLLLATPTRADLLAEKAPAELTGSKTVRVTETRGEEILSVGKRASAGLRVSVPARPDSDAKKKIAPGGWYLVVEADLRRAKADADVRVRWKDASTAWEAIDWKALDEDPAAATRADDESGTRPLAGRAPAAALAGRVLGFVPLPDGAARELDLEFENQGRKLAVRAARVMRFHDAPSRAMRGKANGPFGPDQIGCGMLGFTASRFWSSPVPRRASAPTAGFTASVPGQEPLRFWWPRVQPTRSARKRSAPGPERGKRGPMGPSNGSEMDAVRRAGAGPSEGRR